MGRGGARVGAGRKPKGPKAVVIGLDGARVGAGWPTKDTPSSPQLGRDLENPPADLPEAQQVIWRRYAPDAIDRQTLVPATVAGFRELCEQYAIKQTIARRIEKLGAASKRAESQLRAYVRLAQRLDASLARFKLTSFGKPADGVNRKSTAAANLWAQVAAK